MEKMKIVAPITAKNSRFAGGADMGKSHIEIHKKERSFWHEGEPLIIVVGDEKVQPYTRKNLSELPEESIVGLALDSAIAQGVKTPEEFREYNQKRRKSRRKTYEDYVLSCSKNWWGSQEKKLAKTNTKGLTGKKKLSPDKLRTEKQNLAVIKSTKVAIDSSLFYLSNAKIYEEVLAKGGEELLNKYREAEEVTLARFVCNRTLLPGAFRKEIHLDESGAIHAQVYSTFYQKQHIKRGKTEFDQVQWAKSKIVQEALEKFAEKGGWDLNCAYRALIESRKEIDEEVKKAGGNRENIKNVDVRFYKKYRDLKNLKKSGTKVPEPSDREKANFCHDLHRLFQRRMLRKLAHQTFAEYGFDYHQMSLYVTDGRELSKREYQRKLDREKKLQHREAELTEKEVEHTAKVTSLEKEKEEVKKRKEESRKHEEEVKKREEEVEKQKQHQASLLQQAKVWFKAHGFESEEEGLGLVGFFKRAFSWAQAKVEKVAEREKEVDSREQRVAEREEKAEEREKTVTRREKSLDRRTREVETRLEDAQSVLSEVSSWQAQQLRAQTQTAQNALRSARKATYEEEEEDDLEL